MKRIVKTFLATLCCTFSSLAIAETLMQMPRVSGEISVDGIIDEDIWQQAKTTELIYNTRPGHNTPAPVKTTVYYMENGETLFIAYKAFDPNPEQIRAYFRNRDNVWSDDYVGVKIDPYNNHRLAIQFFSNPFGVQADSIENAITRNESSAWDAIWQSQGKINDDGYVVEMAIPFRIFNFNESVDKQKWAIEFTRSYPRDERLRLSHIQIDRANDCWVCQMPAIEGFANLKQGKSFTIVPTLVAGKSQSREKVEMADETSYYMEEWEDDNLVEPSLDVNWRITPDITLNATVNPDFSQVEADSGQLNINNNFTLFFPEKRSFFLENHEYFTSLYNFVYTRNIGAPTLGAKVTGRIDGHSFGAFAADDEKTTFLVPGNLGSGVAVLEQESKNAALRYRYDANEQLSIGFLSTIRDSDNYHNILTSMDARYRPTDNDDIRMQLAYSDTQYPADMEEYFCDEEEGCSNPEDISCDFRHEDDCNYNEQVLRTVNNDSFGGHTLNIRHEHNQKNWDTKIMYWQTQPGFRADLGFQGTVDSNKFVIGAGYNWFSEDSDSWWNKIRFSGDWDISHNFAGEIREKEVEAYVNINGTLQSFVRFGCSHNEHVGNRWDKTSLAIDNNSDWFSQNRCLINAELRPNADIFTALRVQKGSKIDFSNNRLGKFIDIRPRIEYAFNEHLRFTIRHTYQTLDADNAEVFTANLTDFRAVYNWDVRSSLKLNIVRSQIERNQANYLYDEVTKDYQSVGTQLIYSYKLNPQTVFFLGYSDSMFSDDDISDLTKDQRSIFTKFSYAWLM